MKSFLRLTSSNQRSKQIISKEKQLAAIAGLFADLLEEYKEVSINIPTTDAFRFIDWYERSYNLVIRQSIRKECLSWARIIASRQQDPDTATFICNHDDGVREWIVSNLTEELFKTVEYLGQVNPSRSAAYHARVKAIEIIIRKLADLIIEED